MLPPQKPARLPTGWDPGLLFGQTQPTVASPDPLETLACIPAKSMDVLESRNRRSRHRPTDKAALSRDVGRKTLHHSVLLPPLRGTQCITVLITSWASRKKHTKRRFSLHPSPPVQGWGSEWTSCHHGTHWCPGGEGGILGSCCVSAPTAG